LIGYTRGDSNGETWDEATQARQWRLDGLGNWSQIATKTEDVWTTETRLDTSFNEYYNVAGASQTHDDNGNLTSDTERQYQWDAFNRLRAVFDEAGTTIAIYLYDPGNRRMLKSVRKDTGGGATYDATAYAYRDWQVLEEASVFGAASESSAIASAASSTKPTRQYVYGNYIDEPLVMDVNCDADGHLPGSDNFAASTCDTWTTGPLDRRYFYHQNTIYSVYGLTDPAAELVEAYEYDPYGRHVLITDGNDENVVVDFSANDSQAAMAPSVIGNPCGFTGQRYDCETYVYCYRNRYYDPDTGRFISRDPIAGDSVGNTYYSEHIIGDSNRELPYPCVL
jgi:RHS repeat-associated protein